MTDFDERDRLAAEVAVALLDELALNIRWRIEHVVLAGGGGEAGLDVTEGALAIIEGLAAGLRGDHPLPPRGDPYPDGTPEGRDRGG